MFWSGTMLLLNSSSVRLFRGDSAGFLDIRGPILKEVWGTKVPQQGPEQSPWWGSGGYAPKSWINIENCTRSKSIFLCRPIRCGIKASIQITAVIHKFEICIQNVVLQIFCKFTNEQYGVSRIMWSHFHCAQLVLPIRHNESEIT